MGMDDLLIFGDAIVLLGSVTDRRHAPSRRRQRFLQSLRSGAIQSIVQTRSPHRFDVSIPRAYWESVSTERFRKASHRRGQKGFGSFTVSGDDVLSWLLFDRRFGTLIGTENSAEDIINYAVDLSNDTFEAYVSKSSLESYLLTLAGTPAGAFRVHESAASRRGRPSKSWEQVFELICAYYMHAWQGKLNTPSIDEVAIQIYSRLDKDVLHADYPNHSTIKNKITDIRKLMTIFDK